jgi:hypothetical protein
MAVASLTRFRPSRIPARKNRVRKCCFTVRELIRSCSAISLLLHPCSNNCNTSSSRGVIFIEPRSTIAPPFVYVPMPCAASQRRNDYGESNYFAKYSLTARQAEDLCLLRLEAVAEQVSTHFGSHYGTGFPEKVLLRIPLWIDMTAGTLPHSNGRGRAAWLI